MEGGAVDALLLAGEDILGSVELCLCKVLVSWCISSWSVGIRVIPNESRIEEAQEQRLAKCMLSRQWCPVSTIDVRAPLRAPS